MIETENGLLSALNGWICLDKPSGMTSNAAIAKVRRILSGDVPRRSQVRIGYVGTLDPFATGVLPIAVGEARKFIPYVSEVQKSYVFTMQFGRATDSFDIDGKVVATSDHIPSKHYLENILKHFQGEQMQVPPKFSAIKINGRRACDLMRDGKNVDLQARKICIFALDLIEFDDKKSATLRVVCSKGTYIRSLAQDIAEKLGTVAFVKSLRRMHSGFFDESFAISLENLPKIAHTPELMDLILPLESPLDDIPALYLSANEAMRLQNGLLVFPEDARFKSDEFEISDGANVLVFEKTNGSNSKFRGIGVLLGNGAVKAVRMCSSGCV